MDGLTDPSLSALRDIRGIGGVPWWPPASGWWLLAGALLGMALVVWWRGAPRGLRLAPLVLRGRWRAEAAVRLRALRRRARAGADPKDCLGELSELLRRIAMARLGRAACAGHTGEAWLAWLSANDPHGFPWSERGQALLTAPYAPPGSVPAGDLPALIEAAAGWVAAPPPRGRAGLRPARPGAPDRGRV